MSLCWYFVFVSASEALYIRGCSQLWGDCMCYIWILGVVSYIKKYVSLVWMYLAIVEGFVCLHWGVIWGWVDFCGI